METNIAVGRLWHKRGKYEYFCARQLLETFPNLHFEFHIVLHDYEHRDEWTEKIESLDNKNVDFNWYSLSDMNNFMKDSGYVIDGDITKFVESKGHHMQFYHILIGLYLAKKGYKYMLTYEYDILFNEDRDISELREYLENKMEIALKERKDGDIIVSKSDLDQSDKSEKLIKTETKNRNEVVDFISFYEKEVEDKKLEIKDNEFNFFND